MNKEISCLVGLLKIIFQQRSIILCNKLGDVLFSQGVVQSKIVLEKLQSYKSCFGRVLQTKTPLQILDIKAIAMEPVLESLDIYPIKVNPLLSIVLCVFHNSITFEDIMSHFWQNPSSINQGKVLRIKRPWSRREKEVLFFSLLRFSTSEVVNIFEKSLNQRVSENSVKIYLRRAVAKTNTRCLSELRQYISQLSLLDYFPFSFFEHNADKNGNFRIIFEL